jgi:hypothetical protein
MIPVVVLNPLPEKFCMHNCPGKGCKHGSHKKKRRSRKKNPMMPLGQLAIAGLVGAALGGASYALGMTTLGPAAIGGITAVTGVVAGVGLGMVSPTAGAGVAGAGLGLGADKLLTAFVASPAKTAAGTGMGRVINMDQAAMGRVIAAEVAQQLEMGRGGNVSARAGNSYARRS